MTTKSSFEELKARALQLLAERKKTSEILLNFERPTDLVAESELTTPEDKLIYQIIESDGLEANPEQIQFIRLCAQGKNCILIGAAGTGKTTTQGINAHVLMQSGKIPPLRESTKWLTEGSPGVAIISFTNKAVNNIRYKMPGDLRANCVTIHKLLEFAPIWYEVEGEDGEIKKSMRFEPTRNRFNPLPSSLKMIVIEESSMVSTELYALLLDALPHDPQIILLGDIYQLPPVYGTAILGFKMLEWPIVELTKIFRQALESPIISLAWKIKNGELLSSATETINKRITVPSFASVNVENKVLLRPWQKKLGETEALLTATKFFCTLFDNKEYDPDEDIILIPFNKAFGSIELNNGIANYLGKKRQAVVHEIIAGFKKYYLAVGDKVMFQKEDCYIEDIVANAEYLGKPYQKASKSLDRWGHQEVASEVGYADSLSSLDDVDKFLEAAAGGTIDEDRTTVASHTLVLRRLADNVEIELDTAGEVNNIIGGYAITIHKAQGSEWRKVFCVFHHTHSVMLQRELLYTAVTRAKESLYVICEPNTFEKGILSQRIKGTTLAEKAEYFKGKQEEMELALEKRDKEITISPLKVKIADLVSEEIKQVAEQNLTAYWTIASRKFGERIGKQPFLDFNLYRKSAIGLANYQRQMIKLNPVYLAAGDKELCEHILTTTVIHEICHFVSFRVYKERGHGFYWKLCMRQMGVPADRICPLPVPEYLASKVDLVNQKFEELRGQRDVTPTEEGEQE